MNEAQLTKITHAVMDRIRAGLKEWDVPQDIPGELLTAVMGQALVASVGPAASDAFGRYYVGLRDLGLRPTPGMALPDAAIDDVIEAASAAGLHAAKSVLTRGNWNSETLDSVRDYF